MIMLWRKKRFNWPELRFIAPFVCLIGFGALYEAIVTFQFRVNPTIWFKVYTLGEFICINYFFYKLLGEKYKKWFVGLLIGFILTFIGLQVIWLTGGSGDTDSGLVIFEIVLVYVASIIWFRNVFTDMTLDSFWDSPAFYFVAG